MLERTILSNLIYNEEYYKKVYPFIKQDYFEEQTASKIFSTYSDYVNEYKKPPSLEALKLCIEKRKDLNEHLHKDVVETISDLNVDSSTDLDFLIKETEEFCQNRDLYNAIRKSILVLDGQEKQLDKGSIPKLLQDSLGISFDSSVGHDYFEDYENRYDFYHRKEERTPFDIDILNKITKGGLPRKSMTVLLACCVHPDTKIRIRRRKISA